MWKKLEYSFIDFPSIQSFLKQSILVKRETVANAIIIRKITLKNQFTITSCVEVFCYTGALSSLWVKVKKKQLDWDTHIGTWDIGTEKNPPYINALELVQCRPWREYRLEVSWHDQRNRAAQRKTQSPAEDDCDRQR